MPPSSESNIKVLKINLLLHVLSSTMDGERDPIVIDKFERIIQARHNVPIRLLF